MHSENSELTSRVLEKSHDKGQTMKVCMSISFAVVCCLLLLLLLLLVVVGVVGVVATKEKRNRGVNR